MEKVEIMCKVVVRKYDPVIELPNAFLGNRCYLGISVGNPSIMSPKLQCIFRWIDQHFDNCKILIGDYLHRTNEYIFYGKGLTDAIEKCRLLGVIIQQQIESCMDIEIAYKFEMIHWENFLASTTEFTLELQHLRRYYNNNSLFKEAIHQSSELYIEKQIRNRQLYIPKEEAVLISIDYLLEEMAVFSVLAKMGYVTQIYPGEILPVLKSLNKGIYPDFKSNLKHAKYIEINIKSKQRVWQR